MATPQLPAATTPGIITPQIEAALDKIGIRDERVRNFLRDAALKAIEKGLLEVLKGPMNDMKLSPEAQQAFETSIRALIQKYK